MNEMKEQDKNENEKEFVDESSIANITHSMDDNDVEYCDTNIMNQTMLKNGVSYVKIMLLDTPEYAIYVQMAFVYNIQLSIAIIAMQTSFKIYNL
jgi:hypothetical protein